MSIDLEYDPVRDKSDSLANPVNWGVFGVVTGWLFKATAAIAYQGAPFAAWVLDPPARPPQSAAERAREFGQRYLAYAYARELQTRLRAGFGRELAILAVVTLVVALFGFDLPGLLQSATTHEVERFGETATKSMVSDAAATTVGWALALGYAGVIALFAATLLPRLAGRRARAAMKGWFADGSKIRQRLYGEARDLLRRNYMMELPAGVPADLASPYRPVPFNASGYPVAYEIAPEDHTNTWATRVPLGAAGEAVLRYVGLPMVLLGGGWIAALIAAAIASPLFYFGLWPIENRRKRALRTAQQSGEVLAWQRAGGRPWALDVNARLRAQAEAAAADTSPTIRLGLGTGIARGRGDSQGYDESGPVNLSINDLHRHVAIFGGTGTGKTQRVLLPMIRQIASLRAAGSEVPGVVVIDGKGALGGDAAADLAARRREHDPDLPAVERVDPAETAFSLTQGVPPVLLAQTIVDTVEGESARQGENAYFVQNAEIAVRMAAVLAESEGRYSLARVRDLALSSESREDALRVVDQNAAMVSDAIAFFDTLDELGERTRGSILSHVQAWFRTIIAHPDLYECADRADDRDPLRLARQGGIVAIIAPEHRYGDAGPVVTALLKARLFNALKARAEMSMPEGETAVLLVADEAQDILTTDDVEMLAKGRSLGLAYVLATQTIEGVYGRLGEERGDHLLSLAASLISLGNRSRKTHEWAAQRAGEIWNVVQDETGAGASVTGSIGRTANDLSGGGVMAEARNLLSASGSEAEVRARVQRGPIVEGGELQELTETAGHALAVLSRAGSTRRDIVTLLPPGVGYRSVAQAQDHS